ncbi:MAG: ImmA/IrrE family metallo-endopeptidase [Candidatus Sabulitectum sp.]|nr:ImmA/IrrE family metallo-endopeptidase [Candidatus Sabulitectum sp.]
MELGTKVRELREKFCYSQDDLAAYLKTSRATVAQMELGNRVIDSVTLEIIADFFGCDPLVFFKEKQTDGDPVAILFRANADLNTNSELKQCVADCLKLGRESRNLREILKIEGNPLTTASYILKPPASKWEAKEQGRRIAGQERSRLNLGHQPITDVIKLIESQGILIGQEKMPDDISGFTIADKTRGLFIFVNSNHPGVRIRFSLVHEYCHAILDTERPVSVSHLSKNTDLLEVRANAFAAHFLVPDDICRDKVHELGKGFPSRDEESVYDENESLAIHKRNIRSEQSIQLFEVAGMSMWFGVSIPTMLYRLKNTNLLSNDELDRLLKENHGPYGNHLRVLMKETVIETVFQTTDTFRINVFNMALEALRRNEISTGKCMEIASLTGVKADRAFAIIQDIYSP